MKSFAASNLISSILAFSLSQSSPFGTPDEVRDQVRERIEILGEGGGFVFCSIHNIQANTPLENLLAMFEVIRQYR